MEGIINYTREYMSARQRKAITEAIKIVNTQHSKYALHYELDGDL